MNAIRTIGLAATLAACSDATTDPSRDDATRLSWELAWDADGTSLIDGARIMQSDLGYTITLEEGWLTTYSAQLLPCASEGSAESRAGFGWRVRNALVALVAPHAWAGHGDSSDATTAPGIIENIVAADTIVLADRTVADLRYCRVHYLVARSDEEVADPGEAGLDRVSLRLRGQWSGPDGVAHDLDVETSLATGAFVDLGSEIDANGPWTVTVRRPLSTLFDGITFGEVSEDALARALLSALADQVSITVVRQ